MNIKLRTTDLSYEEISNQEYDAAFFACGYEERCIYLPSITNFSNIKKTAAFTFSGNSNNELAKANEMTFSSLNPEITFLEVEHQNPYSIIKSLTTFMEMTSTNQSSLNILVDYSSMPRIWFAEILNFIKYSYPTIQFEIDFVYSVGEHSRMDTLSQLGEPAILPGCEATGHQGKTVAIFSLGFDSGAPICIFNKLEPDITFSLIARPGALEDYAQKTEAINSDFLEQFSDEKIYAPLQSVKQVYDSLRELFYPYRNSATTIIVPFGPKPHALASIIAAMNYPHVACLHSSTGSATSPVAATSDLVMCRVSNTYPSSSELKPT